MIWDPLDSTERVAAMTSESGIYHWTCPTCLTSYKARQGKPHPQQCGTCARNVRQAKPHRWVAALLLCGLIAVAAIGGVMLLATMRLSSSGPAAQVVTPNPSAVKIPSCIRVVEEDRYESPRGERVERTLRGVWRGPIIHDEVETTVRNLYEAYRDEVARNYPEAQHQWISIFLAADEASEAMSDRFVVVNTGLVAQLPPWPPNEVMIQQRDEATRLSPEEVSIVLEYKQQSTRAHEIADRPFRDEKGYMKPSLDREKLIEAEQGRMQMMKDFEDAIAAKHGLTRKQYDRVFSKFAAWSSGHQATPEVIDKWANAGADE